MPKDKDKKEKCETPTEQVLRLEREERRQGISRPAGHYSNLAIRIRNGGVRHQFEDSIGGCSANYR